MIRLLAYMFFTCVLSFHMSGQRQVRTIKPVKTHPAKTNLGIGLGITNSVVFLARNTSENNDALGFQGSLVYEGSKLFRVTLEYTRYAKIDIVPTWYDVRANTIESNVHILFRSKGNLYFYPLFGLSYNSFKGRFTGLNDYMNLTSVYGGANKDVSTRWLGVNVGIGLEYQVKPFIIFGSFKMRGGFSKGEKLNIMDVCYSLGVRYNLRVPSLYRLFKGPGNRYSLDTDN